jgi:hypothetical protein
MPAMQVFDIKILTKAVGDQLVATEIDRPVEVQRIE